MNLHTHTQATRFALFYFLSFISLSAVWAWKLLRCNVFNCEYNTLLSWDVREGEKNREREREREGTVHRTHTHIHVYTSRCGRGRVGAVAHSNSCFSRFFAQFERQERERTSGGAVACHLVCVCAPCDIDELWSKLKGRAPRHTVDWRKRERERKKEKEKEEAPRQRRANTTPSTPVNTCWGELSSHTWTLTVRFYFASSCFFFLFLPLWWEDNTRLTRIKYIDRGYWIEIQMNPFFFLSPFSVHPCCWCVILLQ